MAQPLKFKTDVDVAPFASGMDQITKLGANAAKQLDRQMGGTFAKIAASLSNPGVAGVQAAFAGLAIGERLGKNIASGVSRTFDAGKAFQQLSRQTGAGVGGLVILDSKFKQAGLGSEQLASSIFRLQKSIAGVEDDENKGGTGALQKLGFSLSALKKLAPDQQLTAVGRALSGIADPAQRTATAMQIFGRSGGELGAVFNGAEFSRISPQLQAKADLLARNSEAFERASRSIARVSGIVQASATTFYGGVAEGVVKNLQPVLDDMKSADLSGIGKSFGEALGSGATAVHNMLAEIKASGLIGLGEKLMAGAAKTVAVAGDAVKVAGASPSEHGALMTVGGLVAGALMDQVNEKLDAIHATAELPGNIQAMAARRHAANVAEFNSNPANPGVASTNNRAETRVVNNRPLTLPAATSQTLPDPSRRLTPSAPGGKYTAEELEDMEYRRRQIAAAVQRVTPAGGAPDRAVIGGDDQSYLARMHVANSGINTRGMSVADIGKAAASRVFFPGGDNTAYFARIDAARKQTFAAAHTFGQTALDGNPSSRVGWTGARDAFAGFSPSNLKDPVEVARAARERANYFGTSGNGYGGHTGLTSGGLGGGAYGRTGNIWSQISGRVGSGKDHTETTAKNTGELVTLWKSAFSGSGGSGGGSGGATVTG